MDLRLGIAAPEFGREKVCNNPCINLFSTNRTAYIGFQPRCYPRAMILFEHLSESRRLSIKPNAPVEGEKAEVSEVRIERLGDGD
jgi:hypothetical protein